MGLSGVTQFETLVRVSTHRPIDALGTHSLLACFLFETSFAIVLEHHNVHML